MKVVDAGKLMQSLMRKNDWHGQVKVLRQLEHQMTTKQERLLWLSEMGRVHGGLWEWVKAEEYYRQYLEIQEDYGIMYAMSIAQLHNCKIQEGWYNYGLRWASGEMQGHMVSMLNKGVPYVGKWEELVGKRLFISGEQGLGDEIMFSRVLQPVAQATTKLFKLTPEPLIDFFNANVPTTQMVPEKLSQMKGFIAENFDCIISIGDLFRLYILTHKTVPEVPNYMGTNPVTFEGSGKPKVGWCANPGKMGDTSELRKVPVGYFKSMSKRFDMYCVEKDARPEFGTALGPQTNSFMDTANFIEGLDAVITVDTSVAHLALSMRKPTIVLYDRYLDWRWKTGMYPNAVVVSVQDKRYEEKIDRFVEASCLDC